MSGVLTLCEKLAYSTYSEHAHTRPHVCMCERECVRACLCVCVRVDGRTVSSSGPVFNYIDYIDPNQILILSDNLNFC